MFNTWGDDLHFIISYSTLRTRFCGSVPVRAHPRRLGPAYHGSVDYGNHPTPLKNKVSENGIGMKYQERVVLDENLSFRDRVFPDDVY